MKTKMTPLLLSDYTGQEVAGSLISEKKDGVWARWDGLVLWSKEGNALASPAEWLAQLPPSVTLEGELYLGISTLQKLGSILKSKNSTAQHWQSVQFCIFDAPEAEGILMDRLSAAEQMIKGCAVASVIPHRQCINHDQMLAFFGQVVQAGGEGIVIRDAASCYVGGRSKKDFKWKPFQTAEARVVGHSEGKGRLAGRVAALKVQWEEVTFKLPILAHDLQASPPTEGARVTFSFSGRTESGLPRCVSFVAERNYE